jgi:hypothetical protein
MNRPRSYLGRRTVLPGTKQVGSPNRPRPWSLILTAYHEAGHAVVAVHFDHEFDHVSIIPDEEEGSGGRLKYREHYPKQVPLEEAIKLLVIQDAGGRAAEALAAGRCTIEEPLQDGGIRLWGAGTDTDTGHTANLLKQIAHRYELDLDRDAYVDFLFRMIALVGHVSTRILCERWFAVIRVAEELLEHKVVLEQRVRQLVLTKDPWLWRRGTAPVE